MSVKQKPKVYVNCVSIKLSTASFEKALADGIPEDDHLYNDTINLPSRITRKNLAVAMIVHDNS